MQNNLNEIPIFLCCLWSGLAIGIIYDVFRIPRMLHNKFITAVSDLLFGISALALAVITVLYCDDGALRLFTVSGFIAGALIWQMLPGRLIRYCLAKIRTKMSFARNGKRKTKERERL